MKPVALKRVAANALLVLAAAGLNAETFEDDFDRRAGALGPPWTVGNAAQTEVVLDMAHFYKEADPQVVGVAESAMHLVSDSYLISVEMSYPDGNHGAGGIWFQGKADSQANNQFGKSGYVVRLLTNNGLLQAANFSGGQSVNIGGWSNQNHTVKNIDLLDTYRLTIRKENRMESVEVTLENLTEGKVVASFTAHRTKMNLNPNAGFIVGLFGEAERPFFDNFRVESPIR